MRSLPGSVGAAEPRVGSSFVYPTADTQSMSYFVVKESDIGASAESNNTFVHQRREFGKSRLADSSPDRENVAGTTRHRPSNNGNDRPERASRDAHAPTLSQVSHALHRRNYNSPPRSPPRSLSLLDVSIPGSEAGSSGSRKNSLAASFSEYPISQVRDLTEELSSLNQSRSQSPSTTSPQLIMPLISMPRSRGFTEKGKMIGTLKILVAGGRGAGKTSLIRAILHCCEHIVHVDTIASDEKVRNGPEHGISTSGSTGRYPQLTATGITEVLASTTPRPSWWNVGTGVHEQASTDAEMILDRNIRFIDTPGYRDHNDVALTSRAVRDYIESYLEPYMSSTVADSDMLRMLSESGGGLVNTMLFLIAPTGITQEDIRFLKSVQPMTTVIPIVSHADTLSVEEVATVKESISHELAKADIKPLTLAVPASSDTSLAIYAVSSNPGSEYDLADESLLVSSDYMQPLVTTDLARLVDDIFCPSGASWLRHAAANKSLAWRDKYLETRELFGTGPRQDVRFWSGLSAELLDFAQRDVLTGTKYESNLDGWAAALRKSLANEGWAERSPLLMSELVLGNSGQGTLFGALSRRPKDVSRSSSSSAGPPSKRKGIIGKATKRRATKCSPRQDPLGLLQFWGECKCGQTALELLGTVGVVGTFGVWIWRSGAS